MGPARPFSAPPERTVPWALQYLLRFTQTRDLHPLLSLPQCSGQPARLGPHGNKPTADTQEQWAGRPFYRCEDQGSEKWLGLESRPVAARPSPSWSTHVH